MVPEHGRYYHVVGVWDKSAGIARIYVDGVLKKEMAAAGYLRQASSESHWFCIGADAANAKAGNAWNGDVAIARIYDKALTTAEVEALYADVEDKTQTPVEISLSDLVYAGYAEIAPGCTYTVYGNGFKAGDKLRLTSTADHTLYSESTITLGTSGTLQAATVPFPTCFNAGLHSIVISLTRDGAQKAIGVAEFNVTSNPNSDMGIKVIAHRGHHFDGSTESENSVAALESAQKLGVYGSEFDVYVTTDNQVVVYHDSTLEGTSLKLENCTYAQVKDFTLANGETLPTLEAFLEQGLKYPDVKLICEIKSHSTDEKNRRAVEAVVAAVKAKNMESQVEFIAFNYNSCLQLMTAIPTAKVMFLSSNTNTPPSTVAADGMAGIDYKYAVLSTKPEWVKESHRLGMEVNIWTVNNNADLYNCIWMGVDYVTTDNPVTFKGLLDSVKFVDKQ